MRKIIFENHGFFCQPVSNFHTFGILNANTFFHDQTRQFHGSLPLTETPDFSHKISFVMRT